MKILKPKRTIEFKKKSYKKQLKKTIVTSPRTVSRFEVEREPLPQVINDEEILALVVNNSLPCKCLECHEVTGDRNNFEPMVFTHSNENVDYVNCVSDSLDDSGM